MSEDINLQEDKNLHTLNTAFTNYLYSLAKLVLTLKRPQFNHKEKNMSFRVDSARPARVSPNVDRRNVAAPARGGIVRGGATVAGRGIIRGARPARVSPVNTRPVNATRVAPARVSPIRTRPVLVNTRPVTAARVSPVRTRPVVVNTRPAVRPVIVNTRPAVRPVVINNRPARPLTGRVSSSFGGGIAALVSGIALAIVGAVLAPVSGGASAAFIVSGVALSIFGIGMMIASKNC